MALGAAVAQRPAVGGHTWMALQWLLGFRELGWDAFLIDWLDPEGCRDARGRRCAPAECEGVRYLAAVMGEFGLADAWTVLVPGHEPLGLGGRSLARLADSCELLLNVMGYVDRALWTAAPLRVFLDIDPGFGQMWSALGLGDIFAGHDRFVSIAGNLGRDGCRVPDLELDWVATLPPVVLSQWPFAGHGRDVTSVASWRGPFGPVEYQDHTYGLRVHQFRQFAEVPARTSQTFRLALDIDAADRTDLAQLAQHGWQLVDPRAVAGDPLSYRAFIQGSAAEFNVAKGMYVDTHGGWFSDRSACYLASGKPVLAQDTGFGGALPTGAGLLSFVTADDAVAAVELVRGEHREHARAARRLAEEHLASDRVIPTLLGRLGVS